MCCCSYRTLARELIDLALGKAEFAEEIAGIGTERGRRRSRLWIAARQAEARSHDAHRTIDVRHEFEGLEQFSLENLRMLEHGWHVEDLAGGDAVLVEECGPFLCRPRRKRALELGLQFETAALAVLPAGKARIGDEFLAVDQPAQGLELLLLVGGDVQQPVR